MAGSLPILTEAVCSLEERIESSPQYRHSSTSARRLDAWNSAGFEKPVFIKRLIEEISGAVASENPSRSISAVSCRRKTQNQQFRMRVAEARDRLAQ